jgi:hypothetical protein
MKERDKAVDSKESQARKREGEREGRKKARKQEWEVNEITNSSPQTTQKRGHKAEAEADRDRSESVKKEKE